MSPVPEPQLVSAIVVNWNGATLLADCLTSLQSQEGLAEVIVVDNASTDDSEAVAEQFNAKWIPLPTNTGLANAFNVGAQHAAGQVLLFLNNDLALPGSFVSAIATAVSAERVGTVDVAHRDWHDERATHRRSLFVPGRLAGLDDECFVEVDATQREPCAFASGACFAVTREVFERVGRWDAGFFAGWEDVDLSWRLRLAGLTVDHEPALHIRHRVSASSAHAEGRIARSFAAMTGRPRFALKHAPAEVAVLSVLRLLAGLARDLGSGSRLRLRLKAIRVTFLAVPEILRWRRTTYRRAGITPRQLWHRTAHSVDTSTPSDPR